jgi:hypothetical protein
LTLAIAVLTLGNPMMAQDSTASGEAPVMKKNPYTKATFTSGFLIDNQTVMIPVKGTFEFDINHRFGTTDHGWSDLFGIFAGANMRLGFSYVVIKDLQVGFGASNFNMQVDWSLKYAVLKQKKDNSMPLSVTYYGNAAMDTRARNSSLPIVTTSDRFSFFNELLVARKVNEKLSVQAGLSITHFNNVDGYYDSAKLVQPTMKNNHLAVSFSGRYKITPKTAIIVNYDQPLTQHPMNNPHPNLSFGLEMGTTGHTFQVFAGNFGYTLPQNNNFLNQNDYKKSQFVIGFNISRLWNF